MNKWRSVPLIDLLITLESGSRPKGGVRAITNGIPSIGGEHLSADGRFQFDNLRYVPEDYFRKMNRGRIQIHDVLIVKDGATTGKTAFVPESFPFGDAAINEHVFIARSDMNKVVPQFLFFFLFSPIGQRQILSCFQGAAIGGIPQSFSSIVQVPVPPLPEQQRLVRILDEADTLRQLRARADTRTNDFIPALFNEMFGDPATNPKGWRKASFGDVCDCRLGKMLDAKKQTGKHARPYLRNVNVQWGRFELADVFEMDFNEKDREEFRLKAGDVLICEGGEVGRSAIWNDELPECYFQKALHRAKPALNLAVPEFILWLMWTLAHSGGLGDFTTQATIAHLTGVKLKSLLIPLPPLTLQREFSARVAELRALQLQQARSRQRLEDLFQALLHRAFAGEL